MIKLRISKEDAQFLVDDPSISGTPPVGRGSTMMEAIGRWLHNNRARVDIDFIVDPTAEPAEMHRRQRELSNR